MPSPPSAADSTPMSGAFGQLAPLAQPSRQELSPADIDEIVVRIIDKIEQRVVDELERRGRRFSPGVF